MADDPNLIGLAVCIHRIGFIRNFRAIADLIGPQSAAWAVPTRTGHNILAVCGYGGDPAFISALHTDYFSLLLGQVQKENGAGLLCASHAGGQDCIRNSGIFSVHREHGTGKAIGNKNSGVAVVQVNRAVGRGSFLPVQASEKGEIVSTAAVPDRLKINGFAHGRSNFRQFLCIKGILIEAGPFRIYKSFPIRCSGKDRAPKSIYQCLVRQFIGIHQIKALIEQPVI